jgi:AraC-like DNA-binding protein
MEKDGFYKLHVREILPDVLLRPYIRKYYFFESERKMSRFAFHALPNGYVEIFLLLDHHPIVLHQGHRSVETISFISGIMELERALEIQFEHPGNTFRGIWILLTPVGVNRLLGSSLKALTNKTLDLKDYWPEAARWLRKHVQSNGSDPVILQNLDHYFRQRLKSFAGYSQGLIAFLNQIEQMSGCLSVTKLAREIGVPYKKLYRKFVNELGMSPKAYLRIIRFDRACFMLDRYRDINETDIAHQCGYYDQAHFIHEFKKIMNMSPLEYIRCQQERFYYHRAYAIF